jgi:hypothetical protein
MKWNKTIGKFIKSTLIAIGVMLVGALLQGLTQFQPEPGTQEVLWKLFGASAIGLVTAFLNYLKHKNDPN